MRMAEVAVFVDQKVAERRREYGLNVFEGYIGEMLSHAGIPYKWLDHIAQLIPEYDVLLVALEAEDQKTYESIWEFAHQGGTVISYNGLAGLSRKLGCYQLSAFGEGYAFLPTELGDSRPLRFLKSTPWLSCNEVRKLEELGSLVAHDPKGDRTFPCLQKFCIGSGSIERWSVDIPTTIVGLQQGLKPVLKDGIPPMDGTAQIDEGILKADDGIEMNWELDRLKTETGNRYFAYPYADLWREACIAHLLQCVVKKGLTLPFVGYWPDGINSVAMISHDSDGNLDESAETALEILKECEIQSTWCMLEPGYSPHIYQKVLAAGHELAFHYNALETQNGKWGEEEFSRQANWLRKAAGLTEITSNKNHYTRFEGYGELFEWCEKQGILVDQTRGSSKGGNVGFLFGTCHPYFPVAWANDQNRLYDVLELGFLTQDMDIGGPWADSSIITPFLNEVQQIQGVAHFLFHQIHLHTKPQVVAAFKRVVAEAKNRGFAFWTSKQINDWERDRRNLKIQGISPQGNVKLSSDNHLEELKHAVVWIPVGEKQEDSAQVEIRFGVPCMKQTFTPIARYF